MSNNDSDTNLSLKEVTDDNLYVIIKLSDTLTDSQKQCVAPNAVSVAQAHFADTAWFRAIYLGDQPIGFVMVDTHDTDLPTEDQPAVFLWRYMIAGNWQNKGYGRNILDQLVHHFKKQGFRTMYTSTVMSEKESPYGFYIKFGFTDTGRQEEGEQVLRYAFPCIESAKIVRLPLIPKIDLITLWSNQIDKMKGFYRDVLGFMVKTDRGDYVEFENNGVRFAICRREIMHPHSSEFAMPVQGQSFELAFPCDEPEDVDKSYQLLIDNGVIPVSPPKDMPWRQRTALFKDPDGNIHEIFAEIKP